MSVNLNGTTPQANGTQQPNLPNDRDINYLCGAAFLDPEPQTSTIQSMSNANQSGSFCDWISSIANSIKNFFLNLFGARSA